MLQVKRAVRRALAGPYLDVSLRYARWKLGGRGGGRDFSRVKIVAAVRYHNGISSGAELQYRALQRLGIDVELLDAADAIRNPFFRITHEPGTAYIFHCGGPQTANLLCSVIDQAAGAYRIGYWAWELPEAPDWQRGCEDIVHEIWTPSAFARGGLAKRFGHPIQIVPHFIPPRPARRRTMSGPFTVLTLADSRSSFARKNPAGAVAAFARAFGRSNAARLVLKLNGPAADARLIYGEFAAAPNIEIVQGHLDENALSALFASADVLLSLHRAEGFGLPMAEAMACGIPVVATGWAGNAEFMTDKDSILVPYRLEPVSDTTVYSGYRHSLWAEPDIDFAAQALKKLAEDRDYYDRIAAAAHLAAQEAAARWRIPDGSI